ncbi:MAG: sigma-70 family RNA polymerase sigma factor [Verrucomicrobiales bacterium]|nr:sigma-70 family RNA polymerase sigma factor [Verrucomicrobiales bacterium]
MNDWELIRRFAETRDEAAFETIVERHGPMVFASARRQVGPEAAADVVQTVFLVLARKASSLRRSVVLSAWLFRTTGFVVAQVRRSEARRLRREEGTVMTPTEPTSAEAHDESHQKLGLHLDEAIAALSESERQYILVRFFERRKFAELGERFGVSEEAAKKRVARALDRMRAFLTARGVALSSVALGGLLSESPVEAMPLGLPAEMIRRAVLHLNRPLSGSVSSELESAAYRGWKRLYLSRAAALSGCVLILVTGVIGFIQQLAHEGDAFVRPSPSAVGVVGESVVGAMRARAEAAREQKREGGGLELVVLDAPSGTPVASAVVEEKRFGGLDLAASSEETYMVDSEGRCWIQVEDRSFERLELVVSAPGRIPVELRWLPHEFGRDGLRYVCSLYSGVGIVGQILDPNDRPVPGAVVRFRSTSMNAGEGRERPMCELETLSDGQGRFAFDQVPPAEFKRVDAGGVMGWTGRRRTIQVSHEHYARKVFEFPMNAEWTRPLILRLAPGTTLSGVVTKVQGGPVANAVVSEEFRDEVYGRDLAWLSRGDSDGATRRGISAVTDEQGRFALPHFTYPDETGSADFLVEADGFEPYRGTVIGQEAGFPESTLFNSEGRPRLRPAKGISNSRGFHAATVDESHGLDDTRRIRVSVELEPCPTVDEQQAKPQVAGQPLRLTGRVVDGDSGAVIPAYRVFGRIAGTSNQRFLGEGRDGEFEWDLGSDWRNALQFEVQADGYLPGEPDRREEIPGGLKLEFRLRSDVDIWGWVELPNTRPAIGALISTLAAGVPARWNMAGDPSLEEDQQKGVRVGRDGRFRLRPDPGSSFIRVLHPDGFVLRPVASGNDTVLRLEPWASIDGILTENEQPVAEAAIRLVPGSIEPVWGINPTPSIDFELMTKSDGAGRFRFERVPGGALQVLAENASVAVRVKGGQSVSVALRR